MAEEARERNDAAARPFDQLAQENALLRASLAEMRARRGDLEDSSERDPVTGLVNRRRFLRDLDRIVDRVNRHATPAALLHIDLNRLREAHRTAYPDDRHHRPVAG